jgi:hypothetical protein
MVHSDSDPLRVVPMKVAPESLSLGEAQAVKAIGDELRLPK